MKTDEWEDQGFLGETSAYKKLGSLTQQFVTWSSFTSSHFCPNFLPTSMKQAGCTEGSEQ